MNIGVAINEQCPPDPRDRLAWLTSQPEVDIFAGTPDVVMFIEETYTTRESLRGSVPPRRRPRRVAKKLAARGWRAHFDGGKPLLSHQYERHVGRAPALRSRLEYCSPHEETMIRVPDKMLGPQEHDRRRDVRDMPEWLRASIMPPAPPPAVPVPPERRDQAKWGGSYRVRHYTAPVLLPLSDSPFSVVETSEDWRAQDYFCSRQILARRFTFAVRIHAPVAKLDEHARIIGRQLEQKVAAFCHAALTAALGYNNRGRLVARQTSYRPLRKAKRR